MYMNNGLPPAIWSFLLVFGVVTVSFTYFFGMPRALPQAIITTALAGTIASTLYIIFARLGWLGSLKPLIAARITNSANTAKMALMTFLLTGFIVKNLDDRGCATSCISWFAE